MKISVVIPAYNESQSITSVVRDVKRELEAEVGGSFEIIVVDNGSTDDTQRILESLSNEVSQLKTCRIFPNRGYGNGVLTGLGIARGEVMGWIHADSQGRAEDLVKMYQRLEVENLDVCKAVRTVRADSPLRLFISLIYNTLFRVLFRTPFRDINGAPKLFRRHIYEEAGLIARDWFLDAELMIKAAARQWRVGEVEATFLPRTGGVSKVRLSTNIEFLKNMIKYRFSRGAQFGGRTLENE